MPMVANLRQADSGPGGRNHYSFGGRDFFPLEKYRGHRLSAGLDDIGMKRNRSRGNPKDTVYQWACKRLQGAGGARHRPVQRTPVRKQADNTADSVPRDRLQ